MKVRIQAAETIRYSKEFDADEDTLSYLLDNMLSFDCHTMNAGDFTLDQSDIVDGELDGDSLEIDVFKGGKWVPLEVKDGE